MKLDDNKSDPNLETSTYEPFSTVPTNFSLIEMVSVFLPAITINSM
jgi:hypothetical protein